MPIKTITAVFCLLAPFSVFGGLVDFGLLSLTGSVSVQQGSLINGGLIGARTTISVGGGGVIGQVGTTNSSLIAAAATGLAIQVGDTSTVYGDAITGGGSVTGTRIQGVIDTSGANPQLSNLAQAISEAVLLAGSLSSLTPTQVLPGISVGNNQSRSIGTTVAGLNVIQIPTITSGSRFTLTIKGAPGDTVVVNLGSLVLGQQATVNLNGLQPNQVIFNIAGALTIDINPQSISGTFLAPASACAIDQNLTFAGALYCGGNITFGNNLTYTNDPFDPGPFLPAPVPEAGAVYLVGTELAALLLLRRRPYGRRRPA